jgi:hypothetical protein
VWSVLNIDTLDDRALFTRTPEARDYSAEDREERIARRKARWCPTTLVGTRDTLLARYDGRSRMARRPCEAGS